MHSETQNLKGPASVLPQEPKAFSDLEIRIGYKFKDRGLLATAMTHSSYGDGRRKAADNERLEFLGDRVLGLLTAEMLYRHNKGTEGSMARRLNALVRKETCADIARSFDLAPALLLSRSEDKQGGRDKTSILGDACEALLAAIYLDGGMDAAQRFYLTHWQNHIEGVLGRSEKDPKTELQEKASSLGVTPPAYLLIERRGPDHRPQFIISVSVETVGTQTGTGRSKKDAERRAARALLENWNTA